MATPRSSLCARLRPSGAPVAATIAATVAALCASLPGRGAAQEIKPEGDVKRVEVRDVVQGPGDAYVIVLRTTEPPERDVEIWIGPNEALAIRLRVARQRPPRPLTHDLLEAVVDRLGGKVVRVHVEDVRDATFLGRVYLEAGGRTHAIDARPSDSIALALGAGAPIFVARSVIERAGHAPAPVLLDRPAPDRSQRL